MTIKHLNVGDFIADDMLSYDCGKETLKAMKKYCKRHNLEVRLSTEPFYHNHPECGTQRVWKVFEKEDKDEIQS